MNLLLLCLNLGSSLHALELTLINDDGLTLLALLGLLSDVSQLILSESDCSSRCGFLGVTYKCG